MKSRRQIEYGYVSVQGPVRELNEDQALVVRLPLPPSEASKEGILAIVADGMGGHDAGDVASKLAVDRFVRAMVEGAAEEPSAEEWPHELMHQAARLADQDVREYAHSTQSVRGMGTTLTAALVIEGSAWICHVGDSRAYLVAGHHVRQLTTDHSLVQQKVDQGLITDQEARRSQERNVLIQAIGSTTDLSPQVFSVRLPPEFGLLLASDGVHGAIDVGDIEEAMRQASTAEATCADLVQRASVRDGSDNLSAVCVRSMQGTAHRPHRSGSERVAKKLLLAVVLLVSAGLAASLWFPSSKHGRVDRALTSVFGVSPVYDADDDDWLYVEVAILDDKAQVKYRSPGRQIWLTVGGAETNLLKATVVGETAEAILESAPVAQPKSPRGVDGRQSAGIALRLLDAGSDGVRWAVRWAGDGSGVDDARRLVVDGRAMNGEPGSGTERTGVLEETPQRNITLYLPGTTQIPVAVSFADPEGAPYSVSTDEPRQAHGVMARDSSRAATRPAREGRRRSGPTGGSSARRPASAPEAVSSASDGPHADVERTSHTGGSQVALPERPKAEPLSTNEAMNAGSASDSARDGEMPAPDPVGAADETAIGSADAETSSAASEGATAAAEAQSRVMP